jgi:hypothetical protein
MASWLLEMEMTLVEFRFGNSFIAILYLENVEVERNNKHLLTGIQAKI